MSIRYFPGSSSESAAAIVGLIIWFSPVIVFCTAFGFLSRKPLVARAWLRAAFTLDAMLILFALAGASLALSHIDPKHSFTSSDWFFGCVLPIPIIFVFVVTPI